jgi:predicted permease
MLAVLGIRLSQASIRRGLNLRIALLAAGMRLIISPLIALGLVLLLGMSGIARQVALTQAAMPTAVITSVLATEFGSDAEFVTSSILVSTLLSTITLSVLLTLIM